MHLNFYKSIFPFLLAIICLALLGSKKIHEALIVAEDRFMCDQPFGVSSKVSGTLVNISRRKMNDPDGWEILIGTNGFTQLVKTSIIKHNTISAQPILITKLPGGIIGPYHGPSDFYFFLV